MNTQIKYETFITSEGMIKKVTYHDTVLNRVYSKRNNGTSLVLVKDDVKNRMKELPLILLEALITEDDLKISNAIERCMIVDRAVSIYNDDIVMK